MIAWNGVVIGLVAVATSFAGHPHQVDCFSHPARCGYPSPGNTGVPAGTKLSKSGSITITRNGTTISNRRIDGTVTVAADGVTIRNSLISQPEGGSGSYAIMLERGADDFRIEHSEVKGKRRQNGLQSAVWNHYGNPGATAVGSYFHLCSDCWEGSGRFNGDYMVVDASYPGSHDEDIYVCGAAIRVDHSTLINRHNQTATVFGDTTDGCGGNRFVVTNSLLAGGGYVLYPQANSDSPTGHMEVSNNRFARCGGRREFQASAGGTACDGGSDSHGLFPGGGYYGVAAYYYGGPGQVWTGNYWDDNLKPVCVQGSC